MFKIIEVKLGVGKSFLKDWRKINIEEDVKFRFLLSCLSSHFLFSEIRTGNFCWCSTCGFIRERWAKILITEEVSETVSKSESWTLAKDSWMNIYLCVQDKTKCSICVCTHFYDFLNQFFWLPEQKSSQYLFIEHTINGIVH